MKYVFISLEQIRNYKKCSTPRNTTYIKYPKNHFVYYPLGEGFIKLLRDPKINDIACWIVPKSKEAVDDLRSTYLVLPTRVYQAIKHVSTAFENMCRI